MVQGTPSFTSESLAALKQRYTNAGQSHVFKFFDDLSDEEATALFTQLSNIDVERCNQFFDKTVRNPEPMSDSVELEPLASDSFASTIDESQAADNAVWRAEGIKLIRSNKVAVILLAGGQGTRLGSSAPKGCYDIGLPSHKSLFEIQAERILRLQEIASDSEHKAVIPWLVMTSGPTSAATQKKFEDEKFFGLNPDDVFFFNQGVLPCFDFDGKFMLEGRSKVA
ncbi:UDP-N-acetylglucosamine pyrophosphorylase, partial [Linderina macrospora]